MATNMKNRKKFVQCNFPDSYPQSKILSHEVLISFYTDIGALRFNDWWNEQGSYNFQEYVDEIKKNTENK